MDIGFLSAVFQKPQNRGFWAKMRISKNRGFEDKKLRFL